MPLQHSQQFIVESQLSVVLFQSVNVSVSSNQETPIAKALGGIEIPLCASRPLRGLCSAYFAFPPLKRRATAIRPALRDWSAGGGAWNTFDASTDGVPVFG
jgi:hypothetical protein